MKHSKKILAGGAVVLASVALAAPSFADPERTYSAVGSDTIQDVWNGLTNGYTIGTNTTPAVAGSIASWNATSNGLAYQSIQTKQGGPWICRPNGSGDGSQVLSNTYNPASGSTTWAPAGVAAGTCNASHLNGTNAVDFGRSSSGPSAGSGLTYVAFARDAVSVAYNTDPAAGQSTGLPAGLNLNTADLQALYSGKIPSGYTGPVTITDTAYTPATAGDYSADPNPSTGSTLTVAISGVPVVPELPQGASGTRKFFIASALGLSNTVGGNAKYVIDPSACTGTSGTVSYACPLPENNATDARLTGTSTIPGQIVVPGALIPFSAAQWLSQANSAAPNTLGANVQIASINSSAAIDTTTTPASQGPLFGTKNSLSGKYTDTPPTGVGAFERDTYDVVPTTFLGSGATAGQGTLSSILTGSAAGQLGSSSARTVIQTYGFGYLSYLGNSSNAAAEISGAWKG